MRSRNGARDSLDNDHMMVHNDIVVLASDGVTDNLFDEQIIDQCLKPHMGANGDLPKPEDAALCISSLAETISYS